jgi:predicted nucleic acid-binding protein
MTTSMETKTDSSNIVIADSSALVALTNPNDFDHQRALTRKAELEALQASILIPTEVFSETVNIMGKKFGHALASEAAEVMMSAPLFLVVDCSSAYTAALERFRQAPDSVSFTDCLVLASADHYNTKQIFGFEEYFQKQGYEIPSPDELEEAA